MPLSSNVQNEQKLAYLSQYTSLDNPYVEGELHPLREFQENHANEFWIRPLEGKYSCWYRGYAIHGVPYPCPVDYDAEKDVYRVQGMFCWFSCVLKWILDHGGHQENQQRQLLLMMARDKYGYKTRIRPMNKLILTAYGGPLEHKDYLNQAASGDAPLPLFSVRTGYPFIPVDLLIEFRNRSVDFLQLKPPQLAPPSTIQQPFFKAAAQPASENAIALPVVTPPHSDVPQPSKKKQSNNKKKASKAKTESKIDDERSIIVKKSGDGKKVKFVLREENEDMKDDNNNNVPKKMDDTPPPASHKKEEVEEDAASTAQGVASLLNLMHQGQQNQKNNNNDKKKAQQSKKKKSEVAAISQQIGSLLTMMKSSSPTQQPGGRSREITTTPQDERATRSRSRSTSLTRSQ